MPTPTPDSPYQVPLEQLTGKHSYARSLGSDGDDSIDPGASVAYVAEELKAPRHSAYTIEGTIELAGLAAQNAVKTGGWTLYAIRAILAGILIPAAAIGVARLLGW